MERTPVASSTIRNVGYDAGAMTLEVEFLNERVYQYFDVPQQVFDGLMTAPSVGEFFNANIKNVYRFARV